MTYFESRPELNYLAGNGNGTLLAQYSITRYQEQAAIIFKYRERGHPNYL